MQLKVAKFGGTSVADAAQLRRVKAIVEADPGRRWVVPSAPGKRSNGDQKITDLLYLCHEHAKRGVAFFQGRARRTASASDCNAGGASTQPGGAQPASGGLRTA